VVLLLAGSIPPLSPAKQKNVQLEPHAHIRATLVTSLLVLLLEAVGLLALGRLRLFHNVKVRNIPVLFIWFPCGNNLWTRSSAGWGTWHYTSTGYRAGLRGGNGGNCPGLPAARRPPWLNLFVSNKLLVWKIWCFRRYTRMQPYIIFLCCVWMTIQLWWG